MPTVTAALLTIAKIWKQAKCPRKKEILMFATIWVSLEGNMLSGISQIEKDKYCKISLMFVI